jgi:thioredoxin-related protein
MKLRITTLFLFSFIAIAAWGGDIQRAADLHLDGEDASRTGKPIVMLVSAADCPYCEVLKDNVFIGMERDDRIILRELATDNPLRLIDFDGNITDHQDFARKHGLYFTPTVLFLDGSGHPLSEPIVGVANVDFYAYYLERRIDKSRQVLGGTTGSEIVLD